MQTITKTKIVGINQITNDIREFILVPDRYRRFEIGQFIQLTFEKVTASDLWPDSRPFSLASCYDKNKKSMRLIVRKKGEFTSRMFNELEVDSEVTIKYAFGDMLIPNDTNNDIILIAGGTGIAPFLGFAESEKCELTRNINLFYSVKTEDEFIEVEELMKRFGKKNVHLYTTREEVKISKHRRIQIEDILSCIKSINQTDFFISGSKDFIDTFSLELNSIGANNIFKDEWE